MELEYARNNWRYVKGLRLAHSARGRDPEMRWLAELFPLELLEDAFVPDEVAEQRLSEWCAAHPEDTRALAHLARVREDLPLMDRAVSMGDIWAMGWVANRYSVPDERRFQMACASAEQDDATGTFSLSQCFRECIGCERSESLADELLERAADLGCINAYEALFDFQKDPEADVQHCSCSTVLP